MAGTYTFKASYASSGCTTASSNAITVTVNPAPVITFSGADTGCTSVSLTAAGGTSYQWSGGNSTNTANNTFATSGAYTITATSSQGCSATAATSVTVLPALTTALINGGTTASTSVCGTLTTGALGANTPVQGTGTWTQTSGPGTTIFSNANYDSTTATASVPGTYVYKWTIGNGLCTSSSASITVNYYATPTAATVANATLNYCGTLRSASLGGNTPAIGTGTWTQLSGPGSTTFSSVHSGSSTATATIAGTYVYTWTISNGTCATSQANVTVIYYTSPVAGITGSSAGCSDGFTNRNRWYNLFMEWRQ